MSNINNTIIEEIREVSIYLTNAEANRLKASKELEEICLKLEEEMSPSMRDKLTGLEYHNLATVLSLAEYQQMWEQGTVEAYISGLTDEEVLMQIQLLEKEL